jgi:hypothetical protein
VRGVRLGLDVEQTDADRQEREHQQARVIWGERPDTRLACRTALAGHEIGILKVKHEPWPASDSTPISPP